VQVLVLQDNLAGSESWQKLLRSAGVLAEAQTNVHAERHAATPPTAPPVLTATMLGVGGLSDVVAQLNARIWLPHVASPDVTRRLDVTPPLGLLLYGPPGCGKSLLAVQLARCLTPRPPRIVKGPELKRGLWGGDEKGIRALFTSDDYDEDNDNYDDDDDDDDDGYYDDDDDEDDDDDGGGDRSGSRRSDQRGHGDALHVVILDEAEVLLTSRDSSSMARHDNSNVAQFLSCMDGAAKRLDEARATRGSSGRRPAERRLIIALTNRLDMVDAALLRPGRFEVQLELTPPNEAGRLCILELELAGVRRHGALAPDADASLPRVAAHTLGFSGADLAGLVRAAKSLALARAVAVTAAAAAAAAASPSAVQPPQESAASSNVRGVAVASSEAASSELASSEVALQWSDLFGALVAELRRREQRDEPGLSAKWVLEAEAAFEK
jgi:vesicle-fusing ATPase